MRKVELNCFPDGILLKKYARDKSGLNVRNRSCGFAAQFFLYYQRSANKLFCDMIHPFFNLGLSNYHGLMRKI